MSQFRNILITSLIIIHHQLEAQSVPQALDPGLSVEHVINVPPNCSRIAIDPVSHDLFYTNLNGDIHRVTLNDPITDNVVFTTADHHIQFLQGMVFYNSFLYLVGDVTSDVSHTHGMVMKGKLKPNGNAHWDTVMYTALYPTGNTFFDHGFSGITISPDGKNLYVNSGSRTDHGEEQNNDSLFPGTREVPLTSAIFKIASKKKKLFLPNDSAAIAKYVFCDGVRNSFDLAFASNGDLFGCENSGDRDDPDELNWLRKGKHYGFPWILGGDYNPMQFPDYDPETDVMLSKHRYAYNHGFYHNDPAFPPFPSGLQVVNAIQNLGPDADYFRDSVTGLVNDASITGHNLKSFTPHRAPVGLVFDYNDTLAEPYKGDAFMLGFQRQGDSSGVSPDGKSGTLLDPSEDLLHVKLTKNGFKYTMNCTRIVEGFNHPVDAFMDGNIIYVIENSVNDSANIWKITIPADINPPRTNKSGKETFVNIFPNPLSGNFNLHFRLLHSDHIIIKAFDLQGTEVANFGSYSIVRGENYLSLNFSGLNSGYYVLRLLGENESVAMGFVKE